MKQYISHDLSVLRDSLDFKSKTPFEKLDLQKGVIIRKRDLTSDCFGGDHSYNILSWPSKTDLRQHILLTYNPDQDGFGEICGFNEEPFLKIKRLNRCECTFACFGRPEYDIIYEGEGTKQIVGRISCPFKFSSIKMTVTGNGHLERWNHTYVIKGKYSELGLCCTRAKESLFFDIEDENQEIYHSERWFDKSESSDADDYFVEFPARATPEQKALILAGCLVLNHRILG